MSAKHDALHGDNTGPRCAALSIESNATARSGLAALVCSAPSTSESLFILVREAFIVEITTQFMDVESMRLCGRVCAINSCSAKALSASLTALNNLTFRAHVVGCHKYERHDDVFRI